MSTLRERCQSVHATMTRDAILRQGNPIETLEAFVIAERGRAADPVLDEAFPLCLYFADETSRDEFVALVLSVKGATRTIKLPG